MNFHNGDLSGREYISGYGYVELSSAAIEKKALARTAGGVGIALLLFEFYTQFASEFVITALMSIVGATYSVLQDIFLWEEIIQIVLFFTTLLMIMPAFFVGRKYIGMSRREAVPREKTSFSFMVGAFCITLLVGVVGMFVTTWLSELATEFLGYAPTMQDDLPFPSAPFGAILYYVNMALLPGLFEEYAFRGVIMQSLRKHGDGFALIVSSFFFAVAHGNMIQAPSAFLAGLAIGYFVLKSGNLFTGVFIHFCYNATSVLLGNLTEATDTYMSNVITVAFLGGYIILGVIALIVMSRKSQNLFVLRPSDSALTGGEKVRIFFTNPFIVVAMIFLAVTVVRSYVAV